MTERPETQSQFTAPNPGPHHDPSPLGRWIRRLNGFGALGIVGLMLMVNIDVFSRLLFNRPLPGTVEIVSIAIVAIVFLQLPDCLRAGRVMRSDALLRRLTSRRPRLVCWMELIYHLVGASLFTTITVASVPRLTDALAMGEFVGALGHFTAPVWPVKAIIVALSVLVVIQFLVMAADQYRTLKTRAHGQGGSSD